eukprot:scaffold19442_cov112-Isochrysis_galbana.AAC.1
MRVPIVCDSRWRLHARRQRGCVPRCASADKGQCDGGRGASPYIAQVRDFSLRASRGSILRRQSFIPYARRALFLHVRARASCVCVHRVLVAALYRMPHAPR